MHMHQCPNPGLAPPFSETELVTCDQLTISLSLWNSHKSRWNDGLGREVPLLVRRALTPESPRKPSPPSGVRSHHCHELWLCWQTSPLPNGFLSCRGAGAAGSSRLEPWAPDVPCVLLRSHLGQIAGGKLKTSFFFFFLSESSRAKFEHQRQGQVFLG